MKTIVHLIDAIGRGGAENLLMNTVNELEDYRNVVIYLHPPHDLKDEFRTGELLCLGKDPKKDFLFIKGFLSRYFRDNKVDLVHSHSYWTHILARVSAPKSVKVFNSYHFADYDTFRTKRSVRAMKLVDKLTMRKRFRLIGVSDYVKEIIRKLHPTAPHLYSLPNFVNDSFYSHPGRQGKWNGSGGLKMVAVGHAKVEKNYSMLIEAFAQLKDLPVTMDVFGGGGLLEEHRKRVEELGLGQIKFRGSHSNISGILNEYDLFLMCSKSEACPLSPIQAMGAGLPLLLSDIASLKEIGKDLAIFFRSNDAADLAQKIRQVFRGEILLVYGREQYAGRLSRYSKEHYLQTLRNIYSAG